MGGSFVVVRDQRVLRRSLSTGVLGVDGATRPDDRGSERSRLLGLIVPV
jgi:hypothetical protein